MPEIPDYKNILNRTLDALLPLLAVPLAMVVGAIMLLFLNVNPITAFGALFQGAFGDVSAITQTSG